MFTREEILEDFAEVQWLGRRPHLVQVQAYEARRLARGRRGGDGYIIVPHSVQHTVCDGCGARVERRQGLARPIHPTGASYCGRRGNRKAAL